MLEDQLHPGCRAHALNHLLNFPDFPAFDSVFCDDTDGSFAHSPAMLRGAMLIVNLHPTASSRR